MPVTLRKDADIEFGAGSRERCVTVLSVSQHADDHATLRNIFSHSKWQYRSAWAWSEARASMIVSAPSVVICDRVLPDATWRDVLDYLHTLEDEPVLIVTSRTADDQLWGEVLNLGAYDLLLKPFEHQEVVRVVSLAWLNWKNKCEQARRLRSAAANRLLAAGA